MAISLPTPPIAIPTVALLSAGASFTPSPIIHTSFSSFSLLSINLSLSSGIHSEICSDIFNALAILPAAFALSPVSKTGATPSPDSFEII